MKKYENFIKETSTSKNPIVQKAIMRYRPHIGRYGGADNITTPIRYGNVVAFVWTVGIVSESQHGFRCKARRLPIGQGS